MAATLSENLIDALFQEEAIIDRDQADLLFLVPAERSSPGYTMVHDVVGDQKEHLVQLDRPGQRVDQLLVDGAPVVVHDDLVGIQKGQRPDLLSGDRVVVQNVSVPVCDVLELRSQTGQLLDQSGKVLLEIDLVY